MRSKTVILGCLGGLLGSVLQAGGLATAAPDPKVLCTDPRGCPDLITLSETMAPHVQTKNMKATDCQVVEGSTVAGVRKLLRFTFTTPNIGEGDLIVGRPDEHPDWFEYSECHQHYHFKEYADYRLWTPSQKATYESLRAANPSLTASEVLAANPGLTPVVGQKAGFCVIDIGPYTLPSVPKYLVCEFQGISVGWYDEYDSSLDGQFIDVTNVAPGNYVIEAEVNSERFYEETNYNNNRTYHAVTI